MSDTIKTTKTVETTEATVQQPPANFGKAAPNLPSSVIMLDHARLQRGIGYYLTLGIRGLLGSKKGALCLLVLFVSAVGLFLGKLGGEAFVAAVTVASGIYTAASTAVDLKSGGSPNA